MSSDRKTVVIVGGSFAGTRVYKHLQHEFNTIIVDPKGFFEFTPLVLRAMVEPESIPHILIPQVKDAIQARVTEIEPQGTLQRTVRSVYTRGPPAPTVHA